MDNINLGPTTQRPVTYKINQLVDAYLSQEISKDILSMSIKELADNNHDVIFKENGEYRYMLIQRCGKKRLSIVSDILSRD